MRFAVLELNFCKVHRFGMNKTQFFPGAVGFGKRHPMRRYGAGKCDVKL